MKFTSILITGGAGFIGASIAQFLKRTYPETRVVVFDNLSRFGSESNVPKLREANIEFIRGDIRNPSELNKVGDIDCLIECSAEPSVLAGVTSPVDSLMTTNVIGTLNCLELAKENRAFFIFFSTSRVYSIASLTSLPLVKEPTRFSLSSAKNIQLTGLSEQGVAESFTVDSPRSLLGTSKLMSELLVQEYWESFDMHGVINRCGIVAGPGQFGRNDQGIFAYWLGRLLWGGELMFTGFDGSGRQVRDFLHVTDVANLIAEELLFFNKYDRQIFNIGGGVSRSLSMQEMHSMLTDYVGISKKVMSGKKSERKWDIPWYITNTEKIEQIRGWQPSKTTEDLVADTVHWMQNNAQELRQFFVK